MRGADIDDARAIAGVHIRSWQSAYRGLVPDDYLANLSVDQRAAAWEAILGPPALPTGGTLVLVDDGHVVGFAHFCPSRDEGAPPGVGEVTSIYLAPECWAQGGGQLLMEQVLKRLLDAEFTSATLWVLGNNNRARKFYEAMGWAPDGAEKVENERGFPLVEMRYHRGL